MDGAEVEGGGDMGWCKAERGGRGEGEGRHSREGEWGRRERGMAGSGPDVRAAVPRQGRARVGARLGADWGAGEHQMSVKRG
jgi:hypothetical protein